MDWAVVSVTFGLAARANNKSKKNMNMKHLTIQGAGGGGGGGGGGKDGGGGGGGRAAKEDPDSLASLAIVGVLDMLGEGEIGGLVDGAKSIYLDDTPVQNEDGSFNFDVKEWGTRNGTQDQLPLDDTGVESPTQVNVQVKHANPYTVTLTNPNANQVRVIITLPSLMSQDKTTGDVHGSKVHYLIQIATPNSAFVTVVDQTIEGKTRSKYQRSHTIPLPAGSNWRIRVARQSEDSNDAAVQNDLYFDTYVEIVSSKLAYPNSALVGMRLDASKINKIPKRAYLVDGLFIKLPDNYDPVTKTYSGIWNGGVTKIGVSDNPAWIMYDLLTNTRYGLGQFIKPEQIDKTKLYQIGKYCDELVPDGFGGQERRFTINTVINSQVEAYKLITDIASAFRGMAFWDGQQVQFTQDAPMEPTMIYSPANVVDGLFSYTGSARKDRHSVVHVAWNDPADAYKQQIEYVEDPALVERFGIRKSEVIAFGCTSRGQAHRVGQWILYTERHESDFISFKVGNDSALVRPGEIVRIHDPIRAGKRTAGRVTSATTTSAVLDAPVDLGYGSEISIRMPDGTFQDRPLTVSGTTANVTWSGALPDVPLAMAMFIVTTPDVKPILARVVSITPEGADGLQYTISCIEHDPAKFNHIDNNTALGDGGGGTGGGDDGLAKTPTDFKVTEVTYNIAPGIEGQKLVISWHGNTPLYELRGRKSQPEVSNWQSEPALKSPSYEVLNVTPGTYEFELEGYNAVSRSGTLKAFYVSTGKKLTPDPLPAFVATGEAMRIRLNWKWPAKTATTSMIELRYAEEDVVTTSKRLASLPFPTAVYYHSGLKIGDAYYYYARVVDTSGNASSWMKAHAGTIKDPTLLLEQLWGEMGLEYLKPELQTPINVLLDPLNLAHQPKDIQALAADAKATADAALDKILNFDGSGLGEIVNGIEQNAEATIKALLDSEETYRIITEDGLPRIAAAEQSLTQVVDDLHAESTARTVLAAQVNDVTSGLVAEQTARATADEALAQQTLALIADFSDDVDARIVVQDTVRATADEALASRIDAISADLGDNSALIVNEATTRATADEALATQINAMRAQVGDDITAAILTEATARADADSANAMLITALTSRVGTNESSITLETATRTTADAAIALQIQSLTAQVAGNTAAINTEAAARATADSAYATQVNTISARLDSGDFAAVKTQATATADSLGNLNASYVIKAQANGVMAGMRLDANTTSGASVIFSVDKFLVAMPDGTGSKNVFGIGMLGGIPAVGINGNLIVDGTIDARSIVANSITADKIRADALVVQDASITTLKLAGHAVTVPFFAEWGQMEYGTLVNTDWQWLIAGTICVGIVAYTTHHAGFHAQTITVSVRDSSGNVCGSRFSGFSADNWGNGSAAVGATIPTDGWYAVFAQPGGEFGGICTSLSIVGTGAKR